MSFYRRLTLNNPVVFKAIGLTSTPATDGHSIYENLHLIGIGNLILTAGGLIPGYLASFYLIDRWGRKPIQCMGFVALTILFIIMSASYDALVNNSQAGPKIFLFLYCLANFFQNFGPNTTSFIIPGGLFPTNIMTSPLRVERLAQSDLSKALSVLRWAVSVTPLHMGCVTSKLLSFNQRMKLRD